MSVKFKLLKQKNLGNDKDTVPEKVYAREVTTDKIDFNYLLEEIAASGIPSNQVKGVLDRMNFLIRQHLSAGHIVQFGELGNFRYALGSTGAMSEEEFDADLIKNPRIVFYPGSTLQKARKASEFERLELKKEEKQDPEDEEEGGI
ncbi:DNA-binding protein [Parabacteroides sp. 52]|uniref:HU family DNA-binding protein n=1 Tax=unclassified Parabacteroides TaxID=2649774 RepID=UPI0013D205D6|nr:MULTISPECIES: DNA-binding protein [unclassified Parabacteroides]MDH6535273.1 putative histone-like DNA-binding protein [Parabacteroides sp. PM5-20]NDV55836.1 DNA-binding protein [Parabacteroides sp. 52]